MRPSCLFPLFAPVTTLAGVGPRLAPLYEKLAGGKVVDLLWHLPSGVIDRRFSPKVADAPDGKVATLVVRVEAHFPSETPKRPYRVRLSDETGFLHLVFFHAREDWLRKQLPEGEVRVVSGLVEHFNGEIQISHPDHIAPLDKLAEVMTVEPVYPLTGGLTGRLVAKSVKAAIAKAPDLPEWQDGPWLARQGLPGWHQALMSLHTPADEAAATGDTPARRRLAFDELLANQLALALVRAQMRRLKGRVLRGDGSLRVKALAALPFSLTGAQSRSLAEIDADMASESRMLRLLQGDVGSGKTVVALLAMLSAVETGAQAAMMAPTEILARQHFATISPLAEAAGIRLALLTGRDKGKARDKVLAALASGEVDILLGTHALFQEDVVFKDLALAVIDEQHRFGVHQRLDLAAKGTAVDMLVMTATPIPRTLLLTAYGDMDVSRLDEKPPGRQPIDTRVVPLARLDEMAAAIGRAVAGGARVYWVCPLVEESETSDLAAAEERHRALSEMFGDRVGLVHGRMKPTAKDAVMEKFASGEFSVLVATTVIEVGVDVPEATVMVIEHAERFGLAQLHQLRGRVGRGDKASRCLLLYGHPLGEIAKARLEIMRATEDGFRIAEEDLRLRGGGEMLGTRQSGLPEFRLADLTLHGELLAAARDDARLILERDPDLTTPRGEALRILLYLFERDAAVRTLRSG
ncbi:ATP-dependent DNA helicase RecG [Paramagnetospirillum marisnigri]|uniref:ATP-dependent DNA helicase RecG n=1 Tax=Paramagnetospirillum marisnigri TaxID=1285242 RepID=A0A178M5B6_9PROT|nr:ATP-dependent DNA helicase RecG [Paramagnetospirillum marisnigri]OAN43941.1 ATP-dependent DNA helicase RecG [Paramagnetospirillum marisnigri]